MGDAPALAMHREKIDRVSVEQLELTYGAADQLESGVITASMMPISSLGVSISWLLPSRQ